jgi:hypothetical protein
MAWKKFFWEPAAEPWFGFTGVAPFNGLSLWKASKQALGSVSSNIF